MTGRTELAGYSLLELIERLEPSYDGPSYEACMTELRTRLTVLSDTLDLPGIAMEREPIRVLVLGDELPRGAWSAQRILR